ncbi:MAG: hypothetical protein GY723_09175 [bacterium]|nr:hypothetical protein [bacterium]MCP5068308.1 hypothetical protein [bacterium]
MRSTLHLPLRSLLANLLVTGFLLGGAAAEDVGPITATLPSNPAALPAVAAIAPSLHSPDMRGDPGLSRLWAESVEAERVRDVARAAELKRRVLEQLDGDVHTRWRLARDLILIGEAIPMAQEQRRRELFTEARTLASSAARDDPDCVECCFYHFAAISRIATVNGVFRSLGLVKESGEELERCLAMEPSAWSDTDWNQERGNLYYGAAIYYRMVPDTWWIEGLLGFRGDKVAAARFARQAFELTPNRVDYRVELGISLVCLGNAQDEEQTRTEGLALLEGLDDLPTRVATDPLDRARAAEIHADPTKACGNARSVELE